MQSLSACHTFGTAGEHGLTVCKRPAPLDPQNGLNFIPLFLTKRRQRPLRSGKIADDAPRLRRKAIHFTTLTGISARLKRLEPCESSRNTHLSTI